MNTNRTTRTLLRALLGCFATALIAQTKPAEKPPTEARPSSTEAKQADAALIELSPFEVSATKDNSYGALNSNSITSFQTELNKMPVSADVFSKAFMDDINAQSVEDMVQGFSAGAGVTSGSGAPASTTTNSQPFDRNSGATIALRGLATGNFPLRNGFFPATQTGIGMTSIFDIDRVEVVSGPQALLFGAGGGGGVMNYVTKQAKFRSAGATELKLQMDQYGHKVGGLDYNVGGKKVALRLALTNQQVGGRRENIGGNFVGAYVQLAFKPVTNTTVRIEYERTSYDRITASSLSITGLSTATDPRTNQKLHYLLATNQIDAPAVAPTSGTGFGPVLNGKVNWENVDSFAGSMTGEIRRLEFVTAQVDTVWTRWLSTRVAGGYTDVDNTKIGNSGVSLLAPNATANPSPGTWMMGLSSSPTTAYDLVQPAQIKNLRVSGVITNDLFGGRAHSQTVFGGDFTRRADNTGGLGYYYVLADSNFAPILLPSVNGVPPQNNGYQNIPVKYWAVANGPVKYPLWGAGRPTNITIDGQNYTHLATNGPDASKVSATNPLGLTGYGNGSYRPTRTVQKGFYFANYTNLLNERLTLLFGARFNDVNTVQYSENQAVATKLATPSSVQTVGGAGTDYSAGATYALASWLRPYFAVSTTQAPPSNGSSSPLGETQETMKSVGGELGLKMQNQSGTVSGALSYFQTVAKNEQTSIDSSLTGQINPGGLNGRLGISPGNIVALDRKSEGLQATLTTNPRSNLRMRFAAGLQQALVKSGATLNQVYNDQFYANGLGQVTYRDGTPVYVNPTAKSATVTDFGAAGSTPLTITMLSTAPVSGTSNAYYANPAATSGQINASSGAAIVLQGVSSYTPAGGTKGIDPNIALHGPILTGAVGLPISKLQVVMPAGSEPPGAIPVARVGERAQGSPGITANYTAMYSFDHGILKGLNLGGSYQGAWKNGMFYYYPNTLAKDRATRALFSFPTKCLFNGVASYDWKWRRSKISMQVNINNMFNHYHIVIVPNNNNGFTGLSPLDATFDQQPRSYVWSMRVNF